MNSTRRNYSYKLCAVPMCENTTIKTPQKLFFYVPDNPERRSMWFRAMRRNTDGISVKTHCYYVCEDHFNIEEDMKNYSAFKLGGGPKFLKPHVVPHIFKCQPDREKTFQDYDWYRELVEFNTSKENEREKKTKAKTGKQVKRGDYSPTRLETALVKIRAGELTVGQASRQYGVPRSTLSCKLNGYRPVTFSKKGGPIPMLGYEIEEKLVQWICDCADKGMAVNKQALLETVEQLVQNLPPHQRKKVTFVNGKPGKAWYESFLRRHHDMLSKKGAVLVSHRNVVTREMIHNWFAEVREILKDNLDALDDPQRLFCIEEIYFQFNSSGNGSFELVAREPPINGQNVTVSIMINAAGRLVTPLYLFSDHQLPAGLTNYWKTDHSHNGCMTADIFKNYFCDVFSQYLKSEKIHKPVVVFIDGNTSHSSLPLTKFCRQNQIILISLLRSASRVLQPLNSPYFVEPLKNLWKTASKEFRDEYYRDVIKHEIPMVFHRVLTSYELVGAIRDGFRKCGLYPFDVNAVDVNHNENIVTQCTIATSFTTFMDHFQSQIPADVLAQFKAADGNSEWTGDEQYTALYEMWRDLREDKKSYAHLDLQHLKLRKLPGGPRKSTANNNNQDASGPPAQISEEEQNAFIKAFNECVSEELVTVPDCAYFTGLGLTPVKDVKDANSSKSGKPGRPGRPGRPSKQPKQPKPEKEEKKRKSLERNASKKKRAKNVLDDELDVGTWVIVRKDDVICPGIIVRANEAKQKYQVSILKRTVYGKKIYWKWPAKEKYEYYSKDDVLEVIEKPLRADKNSRGSIMYVCSEAAAYL